MEQVSNWRRWGADDQLGTLNLVTADTRVRADVSPTTHPSVGYPRHIACPVAIGLWLVDTCNLKELARACAERNRWEFLLAIAPLRLVGATGSPANPLAIF